MKDQLQKLVMTYGLRPVLDTLAEVVEEQRVFLHPGDEEPLDKEDRQTAVDNLRDYIF